MVIFSVTYSLPNGSFKFFDSQVGAVGSGSQWSAPPSSQHVGLRAHSSRPGETAGQPPNRLLHLYFLANRRRYLPDMLWPT
jgi:hypothetical protein